MNHAFFRECLRATGNLGLAATLLLASCQSGRIVATPTELHEAAGAGDIDRISRLLGNGAGVDTTDSYGLTALFYAVRNRQIDATKDLIGRGANPNHVAHDGSTPLRVACLRKDIAMAALLIGSGADPNSMDDDGLTSLGLAVAQEDKELIELLLKQGAQVSPSQPNVHTPLTLAIIKRDPWYFDRLLAAGADPNQPSIGGNTPLHVACAFGNQHATSRLMASGVSSSPVNSNGLTPLDLALVDHRYDLVRELIQNRSLTDLRTEFQGGDPFRHGVVLLVKGAALPDNAAAETRQEARIALQAALATTETTLTQAEQERRDAARRARKREIWATVLMGMAQGAVMAGQQQLAQMNYKQTAQMSALRESSTPNEYFSNYDRIMAGHNGTYVAPTASPWSSAPRAGTESDDGLTILRTRMSECQKLLAKLDAP